MIRLNKGDGYFEPVYDFITGTCGNHYRGRTGDEGKPFHYVIQDDCVYELDEKGMEKIAPWHYPKELVELMIWHHETSLESLRKYLEKPLVELKPNFNEIGWRTPTKEELYIGMKCQSRFVGEYSCEWKDIELSEDEYNMYKKYDGKSLRDCTGLPTEGWLRVREEK